MILYYLGMLLASNSVFERRITRHALRAGICLAISIIWVWLMAEGRLPFDKWLSPYWGGGFNPPGIHFMVYSLLVLFICNGGWALLHEVRCRPVQKVVSGICFLGRNTLYIWLYHMVVHSFFVAHFPDLLSRNIWIRLFVFLAIVTVPVIIKQMIHVLCSFCCEKISQAEKELP